MTLPVVVLGAVLAAATSVHFPVSTNDPQTQAAVDRGLFLYYAYNGDQAARAFGDAAARDPQLAMAYWGIALADGPDLNTPQTAPGFDAAQRAIRHALLLLAGASARERSFVEIMAQRYAGTFADWERDDAGYRRAMLAFAISSRDEDAQLLAAEALLEHGGLTWTNGSPSANESRTALDMIASILRRDPSSVMANHLCIHLYDLAPDRTPALPCAQRLDAARFPPQAEHLAHMPAHYWIESGAYAASQASSERAYALLVALAATPDGAEHASRYAKHDVAVGYSAALMLGNYAAARLWAQRMASAYGLSFDALTALRFGRYADAYAAPGPGYGDAAVRGFAALHLGRPNEARVIASQVAGSATDGYVPQLFLARMAQADGKYAEALRWIAQAAAEQHDALAGELIPFLPAGEVLGFLELRQGASAAAIAAFTQTLASYPNDPRALYGLALALGASGETAAAAQARARFETLWKGADTPLAGADFP